MTLLLAVPVSLLTARLFAAVFEIPFQRYRDWASLRAAVVARWKRLRPAPAPSAEPSDTQSLAAEPSVSEP